ncbi:MAG: SUMF1/EgtB/PvdO family nonheme iron enzyme [Verrucomicrobiales bacterium]|nr:SUMF1/EgtB/PvdO family nonheme iron enzyme [Verrucomicrobiales bacterium]
MRALFCHSLIYFMLSGLVIGGDSPKKALVIGNNEYVHARSLSNPANDATDMAGLLRRLDFDVTFRVDADLKSMKRALREFVDSLPADPDPEAVALVFFAGHGVQMKGENFLIPVDAEMTRDYEVPDETLSMNLIMEGLETAGAGLNLLILDCCRNDPFSRSWRGSRSTSSGGLAMPGGAPQGMFIAFSTSPDDVADDGEGKNSPYTAALLKHLPKPGRPFEEVFKAVGGDVASLTGGEQEPWFNSKFYGNFQFVEEGAGLPGVINSPKEATKDRPWINSLGMKFCPVPGRPGVLMSTHETRVKDFRAFTEATDYIQKGGAHLFEVKEKPGGGYTTNWVHREKASWEEPGFLQSDEHPVVCVTWDEAKQFATWLSAHDGNNYRLPRDVEWSAAVGSERFPWGEEWPPPTNAGNFWDLQAISNLPGDWSKSVIGGIEYDDGAERTARVGSYDANDHGFFDLAGNVWEWLEDDYRPELNSSEMLKENASLKESRDEKGRLFKVIRGGAWDNFSELDFRSELRDFDERDRRDDDYGFRVVVEFGQ